MKTALQIATKKIAELWSSPGDDPSYTKIMEVLDETETEMKQQISKAFDDATKYIVGGAFIAKTGKQYYEKMYNDKK